MCVWGGHTDQLIIPFSFQKGRTGVILSSPKPHGEHSICSLDLWTVAEDFRGKRGQFSAVCPEEAGVRCEVQTRPWNRNEPPPVQESQSVLPQFPPGSPHHSSLRWGNPQERKPLLRLEVFSWFQRLHRCQGLSGTFEGFSEQSACAHAPTQRRPPSEIRDRGPSPHTVLRGKMDCVLLSCH